MSDTKSTVIVGGGLSGLLAGKTLLKNQIGFLGLEKSDRLGGYASTTHHRVYDIHSVQMLEEILSSIEWTKVDEPAQERKKGAWKQAETEVEEEEKFYLGSPFYSPKHSFAEIVDTLRSEVGEKFLLKKEVVAIAPERNVILCQDGTEYEYARMVWCNDLRALIKAWEGNKKTSLKSTKGTKEVPGGINLDWELAAPLSPCKNTVVFPFRYKEKRLRALGSEEETRDGHRLGRWMLFLDDDIAEDREEIAKCIRALKRELHKEFPELKELVRNERIVYLPAFAAGATPSLTSLEVFPNVIYLGAQARLAEGNATLQGVDRVIENLRTFESSLKATT